MNERIKELAIEAGIISAEYNGFDPTGLTTSQRKFAELIVKECAGIANKQFSAASGLDDRDSWTAAEMKKHFGVEE